MAAYQAPHPWDSPGKNTGVGCHFLLQCMKVKSESESEFAQLYPTLSDPMDCSLPGSSIQGTFQARVLEWGAIAFSFEHVPLMYYIYGGGGGLVLKLCPTLGTPWTVVHQAPLSMGFPRQEYWDGSPSTSPII